MGFGRNSCAVSSGTGKPYVPSKCNGVGSSGDLDNRDAANLLQVVRVRILRMLVRAGVIEDERAETLCLRLARATPKVARLSSATSSDLPSLRIASSFSPAIWSASGCVVPSATALSQSISMRSPFSAAWQRPSPSAFPRGSLRRSSPNPPPRVRILDLLERRGVVERDSELRLTDDGFAEREPEFAALATAAVTGNPPAGPEHRQRPAIVLPDRGERSVSGLSAREDGFSVHAATTAPSEDARARETLCKYVLRPPLAQDRVRRLENGLVRILLKRPFSDGTTAMDLDPLSLLCRLAASVPAPRAHRVHYSGVLAAAHRWRPRVVPPPPPVDESAATQTDEHGHVHRHDEATADARPATHRSRYRPWRELLKRTFKIDIEKCAKCGAPMLLRALVTAAETVTRFLHRLGEDPDPPPIAPARKPPFFTSQALRRKLGELHGDSRLQMGMFDG